MVAVFGESNLRFLDEVELEKRLDYYTRLLKEERIKKFLLLDKFIVYRYFCITLY
ncbi:MAG: hypothetical protein C5S40_04775 [ANME-2 cluster archaeon]|nr:hypothetical protein [ANME-2 cluster archaeon]